MTSKIICGVLLLSYVRDVESAGCRRPAHERSELRS